eukprot:3566295-Pleurochrysis_carterae.AAC.5
MPQARISNMPTKPHFSIAFQDRYSCCSQESMRNTPTNIETHEKTGGKLDGTQARIHAGAVHVARAHERVSTLRTLLHRCDAVQVDAVAVAATFGTLCPYGTRAQACVNFDAAAQRAHVPGAPDAATFYADADTDTLLDTLHEAALHAESTLNARVQILHEKGIPLLSYTGGPDVGAAGYGHRATLDGAKRCRACHRTVRGTKYGTLEFAAEIGVVVENYVVARQWAQMDAYEGLSAQTRAHVFVDSDGAERYWAHVGDETSSCARACDGSAVCAGFAH